MKAAFTPSRIVESWIIDIQDRKSFRWRSESWIRNGRRITRALDNNLFSPFRAVSPVAARGEILIYDRGWDRGVNRPTRYLWNPWTADKHVDTKTRHVCSRFAREERDPSYRDFRRDILIAMTNVCTTNRMEYIPNVARLQFASSYKLILPLQIYRHIKKTNIYFVAKVMVHVFHKCNWF